MLLYFWQAHCSVFSFTANLALSKKLPIKTSITLKMFAEQVSYNKNVGHIKKISVHLQTFYWPRICWKHLLYYVLWPSKIDLAKVIYPKYSKHWPYTVTHTIDCVCSKMLYHGLNHGLNLSLFKLISCHIHWIVYVLVYLNFIFEF